MPTPLSETVAMDSPDKKDQTEDTIIPSTILMPKLEESQVALASNDPNAVAKDTVRQMEGKKKLIFYTKNSILRLLHRCL